MTQYPYVAPEAYPSTPAHRDYLERYNTRIVPRSIPSLDLSLDRECRGRIRLVVEARSRATRHGIQRLCRETIVLVSPDLAVTDN